MYIPEKKLFLVDDYEITLEKKRMQFCVTEDDISEFMLRWMNSSGHGDWYDSVMFLKAEQSETCSMADILNDYGMLVFTSPTKEGTVRQLVVTQDTLLSAFADLAAADLVTFTCPADEAHIPPDYKEDVIYYMLKLKVLNAGVLNAVMKRAVVDKTK